MNSKKTTSDEKQRLGTAPRADTDPLVGCPIVCGQYMRASGFFFSSSNDLYLVTARHNALPTAGQTLKSGEIPLRFETDYSLPLIDVYLRKSDGFDVKRLDIREVDGVRKSSKIDVLAIPFDPDPREYGYYVWDADDVSSPRNSTETLDVIGFDGVAFPSTEYAYDMELYRSEIGSPAVLQMENELLEIDDLSKFGLMPVGIDEKFVGDDEDYNGLSGSPVLGNGLVGIHSMNWKPPAEALNRFDEPEFMNLIYTRAEVLPKMLG